MIKKAMIRNFKSIKEVDIDLARVNILIGEPNGGKSNILESVGLLSMLSSDPSRLKDFIRFDRVVDLFHDQRTDVPISVGLDDRSDVVEAGFSKNKLWIKTDRELQYNYDMKGEFENTEGKGNVKHLSPFKYYLFKKDMVFTGEVLDQLLPPFGSNLPSLIHYNESVKRMFTDLMVQYDYEPVIDPYEFKIKLLKRAKDLKVLLPYDTISEGLRRQVFFNTAMLANKDSLITMEEPESSLFPYYVSNFAETIGMSRDRNQYLISTHNNYFLHSVIEKTPAADIKVLVVKMDGGRTIVEPIDRDGMKKLFEADPFLSLVTRR